jgi:hypothetical protein
MEMEPDEMDETCGLSPLLVEVPLSPAEKRARRSIDRQLFAMIMFGTIVIVACLALRFEAIEPLLRHWTGFCFIALPLGLIVIVIHLRFLAWSHRFALEIGKSGISLRDAQRERFFEWSDVSYCHWLPHDPGVLSIQVSPDPTWSGLGLPPTQFYSRVPEPYRAGVEKAIRGLGKWADPSGVR